MAQFVVENGDVSRAFSRNNTFSTKMGPKIGAEGGKIGAQKAKSELSAPKTAKIFGAQRQKSE
jgi:hypothetical protein